MKPKGEPMEPALLNAIMLSDSTIREAGSNKLTLVGIFQVFLAPTFPFQSPSFFVTPFITNFSGRQEEVAVVVRIEEPGSGNVLASASGTLQLAEQDETPEPVDREIVLDFPFPFQNVIFKEAGKYLLKVLVNGEDVGDRSFRVIPMTK